LGDATEPPFGVYALPGDRWPKVWSTNPIDHVNTEIGRCSERVVGVDPYNRALIRLAGYS